MIFWSLVNIALSIVLSLWIRAPLVRAYLIVNYILMINPPVMWWIFDVAHPKFTPGNDSYSTTLLFVAIYNIVLCGGFALFMRIMPCRSSTKRSFVDYAWKDHQNQQRLILITLSLAVCGFIAKLGLNSIGAFRMNDGVADGGGPFLQVMKVLSEFDLIAIILLGELRIHSRGFHRRLNFALIGLLAVSVTVALLSGSRAQLITVAILALLAYRDQAQRRKHVVYPAIAALVPTIFLAFPLLGTYRNVGYDFNEARQQMADIGGEKSDIAMDVIVTRLNYHEVVARVIDYVEIYGPAGGQVYWNNFIAVIPRLIWPGKPQISNDSQELGHKLDMVTSNDQSTSIGLQVIGEAFYEFGWIGLWVAIFQALIFTLIHKNFFRPGSPASMTAYIYASIFILQRDGYFSVIPGLIWLGIAVSMFFLALRLYPTAPSSTVTR